MLFLSRPQTMLAKFLLLLIWVATAKGQSAFLSSAKCSTGSGVSAFSLSPNVFSPTPNTFCFTISARSCNSSSSCCQKGNAAKFMLDANAANCDRAVVTATVDNAPVKASISRPSGAPSNTRVLTISGFKLTPGSIEASGAQICVTLPKTGSCTSLTSLAKDGKSWTAALASSDSKCCPVFSGATAPPKPPTGSCQTCFVWDVLGPKGTPESSTLDWFSRTSCSLNEADPRDTELPSNCCQYSSSYLLPWLDDFKKTGQVLAGFDTVYCNRTSMRTCGTFKSQADAKAVMKALMDDGVLDYSVEAPYDITDNMCPIALAGSTIRLYTANPGTATFDTTCAPFMNAVPDRCSTPDKTYVAESGGYVPFPNASCTDTPGITPFAVDPYMEIRFGSVNLYCINLKVIKPIANKTSSCDESTTLDSAWFWLFDTDSPYWGEIDGVYLLTLNKGKYGAPKELEYTWGPLGTNTMIVPLGLDKTTVAATKPKICFGRKEDRLGYDSPDGLNFLWTALSSGSGKCCPTYYSNTY